MRLFSTAFWWHVCDLLQNWWRGENPVGAILLSIVMAILRGAFSGSGFRAMILEGLLCGALTLTACSLLEHFSVSPSLAIASGGGIGFIGVAQIRHIVMTLIRIKMGGNNAAK